MVNYYISHLKITKILHLLLMNSWRESKRYFLKNLKKRDYKAEKSNRRKFRYKFLSCLRSWVVTFGFVSYIFLNRLLKTCYITNPCTYTYAICLIQAINLIDVCRNSFFFERLVQGSLSVVRFRYERLKNRWEDLKRVGLYICFRIFNINWFFWFLIGNFYLIMSSK